MKEICFKWFHFGLFDKIHCNCFPLHQEIKCFILAMASILLLLLIKILILPQSHKTLRLLEKKMPKRLELNFPTYIKCQDSPIHVRTKIQFNFPKLSPRLSDAESSKTKQNVSSWHFFMGLLFSLRTVLIILSTLPGLQRWMDRGNVVILSSQCRNCLGQSEARMVCHWPIRGQLYECSESGSSIPIPESPSLS